ncbi:hypothetical protein HPB52_018294 [Rhipicephalus sanguineus]|uniref:UBC core domain-containing protein n=1 Tax=Rhipicephalus sanguineus TaxID=34632 RepID=A0A9D4PZS4_RHISA|nr:hypothetical protein HPB52_018294 [Rhipicephalus sanguineus]
MTWVASLLKKQSETHTLPASSALVLRDQPNQTLSTSERLSTYLSRIGEESRGESRGLEPLQRSRSGLGYLRAAESRVSAVSPSTPCDLSESAVNDVHVASDVTNAPWRSSSFDAAAAPLPAGERATVDVRENARRGYRLPGDALRDSEPAAWLLPFEAQGCLPFGAPVSNVVLDPELTKTRQWIGMSAPRNLAENTFVYNRVAAFLPDHCRVGSNMAGPVDPEADIWTKLSERHEVPSSTCLARAFKDVRELMTTPRTPYDGGMFHVALKIPPRYPHCPPRVSFVTTDAERTGGDELPYPSRNATAIQHETIRVAVCGTVEEILRNRSPLPSNLRKIAFDTFSRLSPSYAYTLLNRRHLDGRPMAMPLGDAVSVYDDASLLKRLGNILTPEQ